ncbi:MAG: hypothetical protein RLZZ475_1022 [Pseudomonadota bacterium]
MAEWSKAHAWKVCIRQKRIEGSNPSCSANSFPEFVLTGAHSSFREGGGPIAPDCQLYS